MKLRIFLSAAERPEPQARYAWKLFDARGELRRDEHTAPGEMPRAEDIEAVLPAERVLFARLHLPRVGAATLRELLPFAVEDRLLADPAHIHAVPGATNARGETIVAVVDREWLSAMLAPLQAAGIRPARAWCESALLAGGRGDWNIVLARGRGMLVDDDGVAATFDPGPGAPLALRIALDEAAARGERPSSVRVHHAEGEPMPDLARWSAEAGVAISPGTRWEDLAADEPDAATVNLLEGHFAPGSGRKGLRLPRAALALAIAIAAVHLAFGAIRNVQLSRERDDVEARREAIFRDAFPEARVVVDPDLQMARNLAELRRTRGLAAGDDFLAQMSETARKSAGPLRSIEYANGRIAAR